MIFSDIEDPRGYKVSCTKDRWFNHVLTKHPEMEGLKDEVVEAIKHPTLGIFQDNDYSDRNVYYFLYKRTSRNRRYIDVIIEINQKTKKAKLVTAYMTYNTKSKERMIWPQSESH